MVAPAPRPCHIGDVPIAGLDGLDQTQEILVIVGAVVSSRVPSVASALLGRRSGRRAISQRLAALGTRLGLDPPEDEYNIETSLAYLEQVTGGAAQAVTESSSDAIRLRRSLDTLTQGVVLCDENGTVIYRNGRANALMVSRHGDALAAQAVTEVLEDAWHEGSAEHTLDLYGPPRRTLQVRARQIDDGRRPLGVIALIEDVSERRRLEEIRRDFVANVSHELKTPMGALGLLAETFVAEPDPEVASRLAGRIHNEAFRVSRIIDDLLDLSRIESEEAPPREPVLVNLVMADAIERVRASADQRGIEIVLHEPCPRWRSWAIAASWSPPCTPCSRTPSPTPTRTRRWSSPGRSSGPRAQRAATASRSARGRERHHLPRDGPGPGPGPGPGGGTSTPTAADGAGGGRCNPYSHRSSSNRCGPVTPLSTTPTTQPARHRPDPFDIEADSRELLGSARATDPPGTAAPFLRSPPRRSPAAPETATSAQPELARRGAGQRAPVGPGPRHRDPARDLDRIFERFYRVDHGRSRDTGGTGLGLSIVRHVANNHQGWVDVESREGEGSTFTLVLPIQAERVG